MSRSFYDKVYCEANKPLDKNVPGPAKFNITKPFGSEASKFSMTGKGYDYFKKKKEKFMQEKETWLDIPIHLFIYLFIYRFFNLSYMTFIKNIL